MLNFLKSHIKLSRNQIWQSNILQLRVCCAIFSVLSQWIWDAISTLFCNSRIGNTTCRHHFRTGKSLNEYQFSSRVATSQLKELRVMKTDTSSGIFLSWSDVGMLYYQSYYYRIASKWHLRSTVRGRENIAQRTLHCNMLDCQIFPLQCFPLFRRANSYTSSR